MLFNINETVRVRLTPYGRAFHAAQFALFKAENQRCCTAYRAPVEDAEGWSRWQMHSLMREFGGELTLGNPNVPFATDIDIPMAKLR